MFDTFESLEIADADFYAGETCKSPAFASIDEVLAELRAGPMIVIVDDEDRENEGDLMIAAEMVTAEAINFMAMLRARLLICVAITGERADSLELSQMVPRNTSRGGTAFTVSIRRTWTEASQRESRHRTVAQTILAAIRLRLPSRKSGAARTRFSPSRAQGRSSGAQRPDGSGRGSRSSRPHEPFRCDLRNRQ